MTQPTPYRAIQWSGDHLGHLILLDQTALPTQTRYDDCRSAEQVYLAIKALRVRGAPAIGVSAAYGLVVGLQEHLEESLDTFREKLIDVADYLASSRPTAVNLFWALDRMKRCAVELDSPKTTEEILKALFAEAQQIEDEDRQMCDAMAQNGLPLMPRKGGVLTHCNTGALATAGEGTALAVLFAAAQAGHDLMVYADETRPLLQGARLTTWELMQRNIPVTLICDSMAAQVMKEGKIQAVITGADRITRNGDACNKIGTYSVALLAKAHNIPFYVAAPSSTFDLELASGDLIPIEQRAAKEITEGFGKQTAPENVTVYNPAFDVAPAELIAGIITEKGVISPVTEAEVVKMIGN